MKKFLQSLLKTEAVLVSQPPRIIVVSGLPRSGTSMLMQMLEAGGIPAITDGLRKADGDNPAGYYEFERVKQLDKGDYKWLGDVAGHTVKIISALLEYLPSDYEYDVLFIHRNLDEVLASQKKMLVHREEDPGTTSDAELMHMFELHKASILAWLHRQPNMRLLEVQYASLLADSQADAEKIGKFLPYDVDVRAMASTIEPALYRNRTVS